MCAAVLSLTSVTAEMEGERKEVAELKKVAALTQWLSWRVQAAGVSQMDWKERERDMRRAEQKRMNK